LGGFAGAGIVIKVLIQLMVAVTPPPEYNTHPTPVTTPDPPQQDTKLAFSG
jgi:hypothetical protein